MNSKVSVLYEEWQCAVRKHEELMRSARQLSLTPAQVEEISRACLVAVDATFAKLKQAEHELAPGPAELLRPAMGAPWRSRVQ